MKDPTYGSSLHYKGESGERYFNWQNELGAINGEINARKFASFILESDEVLDFGCGGGHLLNSLKAKSKFGVEINKIARESASKFCTQVFESIEEVPDSSVDVVISNHALEHVPYPIAALSELRRVLRPDGRVVIYVPIDDWRTQRKYNPDDINNHLNTWTPQLMGNSLKEAGFDPNQVSFRIVTQAWFPRYVHYYKKRKLFVFLSCLYSIYKRRRQLVAEFNT
jgi:SAM-dependent methyltransferase